MHVLIPVALLATALGMRHATDPDHVVAVATIVSSERSAWSAGSVGALWGLGHSATLLVVGATLIAFRLAVPPRVGLALSALVGVMLVSLGVVNLRATPAHAAGGHTHPHSHSHSHSHSHPQRSGVRSLLIGVVHGLDGSAAVTLAALATVRDASAAVAYLAVFGVGTLLGMTLITAAIAVPGVYAAGRVGRLGQSLRIGGGAFSIAYGGVLLYRAVVIGGLFGAAPIWTPA